MKIALISFTSKGKEISEKLKKELCEKSEQESLGVENPIELIEIDKNTFEDKLSNHMENIFGSYDAIVFICSTGIAVRLIAPYVKSKVTDPAVIVIDDLGKYTISLLSGHIGGANELSSKIAHVLRNQLIITTASDGRGIDAVDLFAMRHNFYIEDMEKAKDITALMVEGERIKLITEVNMKLNYENTESVILNDSGNYTDKLKRKSSKLENLIENVNKKNMKIENIRDDLKGIIAVTSIKDITCLLSELDREKPCCILRPKNLNIGVGCRRGKTRDEIMEAIDLVFDEHNLSINSISKVGTIDIKHDEQGIIDVSNELGAEMILFSKSELEQVSDDFKGSDFVQSQVGVRSVCEPAASLLGTEMIVFKSVLNGVTIAVSRSDNNG